MSGEFLGSGWAFPVSLERVSDPGGGTHVEIRMASLEESVHQSIWLILGTARGERVMRPSFGCGIHDLVFSVDNAATRSLVAREVREALVLWEPRIDLLDVRVEPRPDQPNTLPVSIEYRVRTTNNVFNLVYPFYLDRSAG